MELYLIPPVSFNNNIYNYLDDRNTTFKFVLGEGSVIKGWDVGVGTMKMGEKALLVIQPEYGYGKSGAGDSIPPNAVLHVNLIITNFFSLKSSC